MKKKILNKIEEDLKKISDDNGLQFNNYRELCNYLSIPVKTSSKAKESQLDDLKLELDIEKQQISKTSCKYIIKGISHPLTHFDKNQLNDLTQYTILSYLIYQHQKNKVSCVIPANYLANVLGYITEQYTHFQSFEKELSNRTSIPIYNIYDFFKKVNDFYNGYINRSLTKLETYKFIFVTTKIYGSECIFDADDLIIETTTTSHGDEIRKPKPKLKTIERELTDKECKQVLKIEQDAFFETMNMSELSDNAKMDYLNRLPSEKMTMESKLYSLSLFEKYKKIKQQKLLEQLKMKNVYSVYNIIYNYERILELCKITAQNLILSGVSSDKFSELDNFFYSSKQLSSVSSQRLIQNAKNRYDKKKEDLDNTSLSEKDKQKYKNIIAHENVEFNQLVNMLLICDDDIKKELLETKKKEEKKLLKKKILKSTKQDMLKIKTINDNYNKHHKRPDKPMKMIIDESKQK